MRFPRSCRFTLRGVLGGVGGGRRPHPCTVLVGLQMMSRSLPVTRPVAGDDATQLLEVARSEVVMAAFLTPAQGRIRGCEAEHHSLGRDHVDEALAQVIVRETLD